jgi:hypothetical protein
MTCYYCQTCGTQYSDAAQPPARCTICADERQYPGWGGQKWTTLAELRSQHHPVMRLEEQELMGLGMEPGFAIGQRALLVQTPQGNTMWDCIPLVDEDGVRAVQDLGGIAAIAISHPHFYSGMVEWAHAFQAPVYLHAADRKWVMRPDPLIRFWEGETQALPGGLTLIRCGGHFEGGTVLHWPGGAAGRGALLTGDIINVVSDRRYVSFMRSFPNLIPLPAAAVRRVVAAVDSFQYDRIYGGWWDRVVRENARQGVEFSARRYIRAITGEEEKVT